MLYISAPPAQGERMIEAYCRLIQLSRPELIAYPSADITKSNLRLIRHEADVPVLLSSTAAKADWLLAHNIKHFTPVVAERTGLRIATPVPFFETLLCLLP